MKGDTGLKKQVAKHYQQLLILKEREGGIKHLKKHDIWTNT